jgi:hypothetical protein
MLLFAVMFAIKFRTLNADAKSAVVALSVGFLSGIIFGIGLIGPLTPSYGHPSLLAWFVFSIVPLVLALVSTVVTRPWPVKIALLVEAITILLLTLQLLHVHEVL